MLKTCRAKEQKSSNTSPNEADIKQCGLNFPLTADYLQYDWETHSQVKQK